MILAMNRAFRILMGILILLLLVAGGGVLLRNRLTAAVVVHVLKARTGCPVRIHGLSQGWGTFEMVIDELEVGNPPGFPAGPPAGSSLPRFSRGAPPPPPGM